MTIDVYNATSFFLCLSTITWATLWFFNSESPLTDPEIALSETERTNRERRQHQSRDDRTRTGGNAHRTSSLHRYDDEIDYTLPSYSEIPPPPTYIKVISSDGDIQINHSEHTLTPTIESSSQNRTSATISNQETPNANTETVDEENMTRIENNRSGNRESLNPTSI
ncbi:hypothetical protein MAM1_0239c08553 [Mucor ambiguus]|uniref:Uncharacterized protein n=1 Tax=Mucor ambiguus TaxID=91626 RepID=A0A0C9MEA7_9FUNG|nr:hypothetical protein MAM1_0239c08553 [Mucor ambiguus]